MVTELTRALSAFDDQVFLRSQQVSYGKAFFFSSLARFPVSCRDGPSLISASVVDKAVLFLETHCKTLHSLHLFL